MKKEAWRIKLRQVFQEPEKKRYRREAGGFPGSPVVKNLPSSARDAGSIPGWGTKIPHAAGQLSPRRNY